jgi:bifunctional UDP-N-acetylglucosamine pyrophosphorylase/glucosamine-1-phosphate N-acetyltransferase
MRILIIPAAGRGSRLGGAVPKPLVEVNGRPMLTHLADIYQSVVDHIVVVAHPSFRTAVDTWAAPFGNVSVTEQPSPTGMLDAILLGAPIVARQRASSVWITWADQVGVLPATITRLVQALDTRAQPAMALPTVSRRDPYIHFDRDAAGRLATLRQRREGDEMPEVGESDMGLFAMTRAAFDQDLPDYARQAATGSGTGERNFVPFVPWLAQRKDVVTFPCTDPMEAVGVNTPDELRQIEAWLRSRRPA